MKIEDIISEDIVKDLDFSNIDLNLDNIDLDLDIEEMKGSKENEKAP